MPSMKKILGKRKVDAVSHGEAEASKEYCCSDFNQSVKVAKLDSSSDMKQHDLNNDIMELASHKSTKSFGFGSQVKIDRNSPNKLDAMFREDDSIMANSDKTNVNAMT